MHWMPKKHPAAREDGLLVERVGDEIVIFDTETTDSHCLGALAAAVFESCDGRTSVERLALSASERLGESVTINRVEDALVELDERNLLSVAPDGLSRRDVMRRGAMVGAAAVAAPLIATVRATPAVAQASKTCGGFRDTSVLCCPCATGASDGKKGCCTTPFTQQCVCSKAEGNNTKYCKPAGVGAEGDTFCSAAGGAQFPCCAACAFVAQDCDQPLRSGTDTQFPPTAPASTGPQNCFAPGAGGCSPST